MCRGDGTANRSPHRFTKQILGPLAPTPTGQPAVLLDQTWSWAYQLLPFLEQDALWRHQDDALVATTEVHMFVCPSRGPRRVDVTAQEGPGCSPRGPRGPKVQIDYAGNAGIPLSFSLECIGRCGESGCDCAGGTVRSTWRGMLVHLAADPDVGVRLVKKSHVSDGLSHTFVVGEKRLRGEYGTCQHDDNEGWVGGWDWDTIRYGHAQPKMDRFETPGGGSSAFGSVHTGSFHVVMADGSVHTVAYDVDPFVFVYLSMRDDGEPVFVE